MYSAHPNVVPPTDNARLWRYMDVIKFVSLLATSKLAFTRLNLFDDPFEGSWPRRHVEAYGQWMRESKVPITPDMANRSIFGPRWSYQTAACCWHKSQHESAAMWKLYLKADQGIAVQTTFARLSKSITDKVDVYVGEVRYIDYDEDIFPDNHGFTVALHKRKSFDHEKEVRALVYGHGSAGHPDAPMAPVASIEVDLPTLIETVVVSPMTQTWQLDLIADLVWRYGGAFPVLRSSIMLTPYQVKPN